MADHEETIKAAIAAGYNLPALSPVAMEAVELASQDSVPAAMLARVIERDPSLAARLLKLANSSFYKTGLPVGSVTQAIVKIGFDRVRMMALSISLRETFPMGKKGPMDYERFWRLSLYRALIAKALAARLGSAHPEEAFVAALLGEVGLLVFYDLFVKGRITPPYLDLNDLHGLLAWERNACGIDHRQVGRFVLSQWAFPESILICQEAGLEAGPTEAGRREPLLFVCDVAFLLTRMMTSGKEDLHSSISGAASSAGIPTEDINSIVSFVFEEVEEIGTHLKIQVDRDGDIVALLEKANAALTEISQRLAECASGRSPTLPTMETLESGPSTTTEVLQAVMHEIRNPLMTVGGFVTRLARTIGSDSEGSRYVEVILQEASRLEKIMVEMNKKLET